MPPKPKEDKMLKSENSDYKSESLYCIYRHLKPCGEVFYVGIGHLKRPYTKQNRSDYWKNTVEKYGYEIQVLKSDLTWKDAKELEIILISWYKRKDCCGGTLVNLTDGGEGSIGNIKSIESRKKMSDAKKGKYCGENNPSYGRNHSEKTKLKISKSRKGIKWSEEQYIKVMEYNRCNPRPQEVRDKISNSTKRGKSSLAKKVINVITKQEYDCVEDASDTINISKQNLTSWLNGRSRNKSNFVYLENYYDGMEHVPYVQENLSKYKYISYCKNSKKWFSNYRVDKKYVVKGRYDTEEEAYQAMINHPLYERN